MFFPEVDFDFIEFTVEREQFGVNVLGAALGAGRKSSEVFKLPAGKLLHLGSGAAKVAQDSQIIFPPSMPLGVIGQPTNSLEVSPGGFQALLINSRWASAIETLLDLKSGPKERSLVRSHS